MVNLRKFFPVVVLVLGLICISTYSFAGDNKGENHIPVIRFGTLPVVHALPLFVASEKGYFDQQGIKVELIPFNSAMEKDMALAAKEISGYFGDILTSTVLNANNIPLRMVATIFNSTGGQRTFAILAASKSSGKTLEELSEAGIAGSSNTVIEYITHKILISRKIDIKKLNMIEIKNIPIRLQMLLSGQVPSATLPEPLVTFAEMNGAKVVGDDAGKGISSIILAFRLDFLEGHTVEVRGFIAAVNSAISFINDNPEKVRPIMNRFCRVPKPLQKSFTIPRFPEPIAPDPGQVMDVYNWLWKKGIIKTEMGYKQMVSDGYLP